jgi:cytochrome c556
MSQRFLLVAAFAVVATLAAPAVLGGDTKADAVPKATTKGEDKNPVQREMILLHEAMRDSVTAIAMGDVRSLPKKLHAVHTASGDTKDAAKGGAYKPPKNPGKMDEFLRLDEAFHKEMISMVKAARKNDVEQTARLHGALMTRCHGCHATFR